MEVDAEMEGFGEGDLPQKILDAAAWEESKMIPPKSKDLYEKEYVKFWEWRKQENVNMICSEKVMLSYFSEKVSACHLWYRLPVFV
jgi:hypothetical protein